MKKTVRNSSQLIIGYIEDRTDRKIAYDFYNRILGYYDKKRDITYYFDNLIFAYGDSVEGLIWEEEFKRKR